MIAVVMAVVTMVAVITLFLLIPSPTTVVICAGVRRVTRHTVIHKAFLLMLKKLP